MKTKITELEAQVAALTKDRDEALAKCAEVRAALERTRFVSAFSEKAISEQLRENDALWHHALSSDCGKGWKSPEQVRELVKPLVESLQWVLEVADEIDDETGHQSRHIQAALDHAKKQGWI